MKGLDGFDFTASPSLNKMLTTELCSIEPNAMQNDRKLSRNGDFRLFETDALGKALPPFGERRPPLGAVDQHARRLE